MMCKDLHPDMICPYCIMMETASIPEIECWTNYNEARFLKIKTWREIKILLVNFLIDVDEHFVDGKDNRYSKYMYAVIIKLYTKYKDELDKLLILI